MPEESKGTGQLIKQLVVLQKQKLLSCKYQVKEEIIKKLKTKQDELKRLPVACTGDWEK